MGILKLPSVKRHHSFSAPRGSHRAALSERKFHYPSYYLRNQNRPTVLFWLSLSLCCTLSYLRWSKFTDKVMAAYHRLAPYNCFVFEYRIFNFQGTMETLFFASYLWADKIGFWLPAINPNSSKFAFFLKCGLDAFEPNDGLLPFVLRILSRQCCGRTNHK